MGVVETLLLLLIGRVGIVVVVSSDDDENVVLGILVAVVVVVVVVARVTVTLNEHMYMPLESTNVLRVVPIGNRPPLLNPATQNDATIVVVGVNSSFIRRGLLFGVVTCLSDV